MKCNKLLKSILIPTFSISAIGSITAVCTSCGNMVHVTSASVYSTLSITGDVSISGNVMGLLDNGAKPGEQGDITGIPCDSCFYRLFKSSTGITSVSEDFLPATTLAEWCYSSMFSNCTSLTTAPTLPATSLANGCYYEICFNTVHY